MTILAKLIDLVYEVDEGAEAIALAISGRETITGELSAIDSKLGQVVIGLSCVCEAIRNLTWASDNPPVDFPVPPPTSPAPVPPGGSPSAPGWSPCSAAYAMIEALATKFDELADFAASPLWSFSGLLAALAGITVFVLSGGTVTTIGIIAALGLSAALWESLGQIGEQGIDNALRSLAGELRSNTELRECMGAAFVMGDGAADKTALIKAAVDEKLENVAMAAVLKSMIDSRFVSMFAYGVEVDGALVYPQYPGFGGFCVCWQGCRGGYELVDITHLTNVVWDNQGRPGEVGAVQLGSLIELSGITSTNTYGTSRHIIDFTFTAPLPQNMPTGKPVVFLMYHEGTQNFQFEASPVSASGSIVAGGNTSVNNAVKSKYGIATSITSSGGDDGIFQVYLGTNSPNMSIKTIVRLYAVVNCS